MNAAPEEIWAFHAPEIVEDNPGCTIVAGESVMHGAQRYVRADHAENAKITYYLTRMDDELLARDGPAELSHEEAKQALRDVYLIASMQPPEFYPERLRGLDA